MRPWAVGTRRAGHSRGPRQRPRQRWRRAGHAGPVPGTDPRAVRCETRLRRRLLTWRSRRQASKQGLTDVPSAASSSGYGSSLWSIFRLLSPENAPEILSSRLAPRPKTRGSPEVCHAGAPSAPALRVLERALTADAAERSE